MADALIDEIAKNGKAFLQNASDDAARMKVVAAASQLVEQLENPLERLSRIGWGEPSRTAALRTAFELGLLAKLFDKPMSSAQLVEGTKADPVLAARIMKHLAAYGIVKQTGVDQYVGTPFSMATNDPSIAAGLIYSFEGMTPVFEGLPQFLAKTDYQVPQNDQNGPVQFGLKTEKSFFALLEGNVRLSGAFNNFMAAYTKFRPSWVDYYPCEERLGTTAGKGPSLVDVGGGLGHDISSFHKKFPALGGHLVLQDQASVVEDVKLAEGIKPVAHDFTQPQPAEYQGAKAYFLRFILHDWPDDKCNLILSNLRDAMMPGCSKILINETVLPDVGAPWQQTSLDWTMMAMLTNRERTESQWRELLAAAGLKIAGIWQKDPASESVIEAVLASD